MSDLFLLFLKTTLSASAAACAVILLRLLFRRLKAPVRVAYLLWVVVLPRMVLPVGLGQSPLSLLRWSTPAIDAGVAVLEERYEAIREVQDTSQPAPVQGQAIPAGGDGIDVPAAVSTLPPAEPFAQAPELHRPFPLLELLGCLWAAGVLIFWSYTLLSFLRLKKKLRTAVRRTEGGTVWYESDRVPAPFVLGFFPAKIYLPPDLPKEARPYVLRHEQLHIQWGDHVVKMLSFLILALHWCNPLLWCCWRLLCRDIELACDERVLSSRDLGDCRGPYAAALLALAAPKSGPHIPPAFGEVGVKERIRRAVRFRRPAFWTAAAAATAAVLSFFCLGCNPLVPPLPEEPPELAIVSDFGTVTARADKRYWNGIIWEVPEDQDLIFRLTGATIALPDGSPLQLRFPDGIRPPDAIEAEDCLVRGWTLSPQPLELTPSGGDGYEVSLSPHPATEPGDLAEDRLIRLTCRWRSGADWVECQYAFILRVSAITEERIAARPAVMVWDQGVVLEQGFPFQELSPSTKIPFGSYLHITHPTQWDGGYSLTCARLTEEGEVLEERVIMGTEPMVPPDGATASSLSASGTILRPMDESSLRELLGFTLTYTWADGHEDVYRFVLEGIDPTSCIPEVAVEEDGVFLRYPGANIWTSLPALLPAPAEWAEQDLAGRNEAVTLDGLSFDFIEAGFTSPQDGWAVVTLSHGMGANRDVYFYRTLDGGVTWSEYGHPQGQPFYVPTAAFFPTAERGFISFGRFNSAPVYGTEDGGETWAELNLPLPNDGRIWECTSIIFSDDNSVGLMRFSGGADLAARCTLISRNGGATWDLISTRIVAGSDGEPNRLSVSLDDLPTETAALTPRDTWWDPVWLLGDLGEIRLYGLNEYVTGQSAVFLIRDGRLETMSWYPELTRYDPNRCPSSLALGDYDGDGSQELAVSLYQGGGTGVNANELCIFELEGSSFGACAAFTDEVYRPLVEEALEELGLADKSYDYGSWISFELYGGRISMELALDAPAVPPMSVYEASLRARVLYNGASFSLSGVSVEQIE